MGDPAAVPEPLRDYLGELAARVGATLGEDLDGVWLIGSGAQGAYEHGVSDVDVLAVSRQRWPVETRLALAATIVHPKFPCPTVGLEFVWYAAPDLDPLADPVDFQLNVNGGPGRARLIALQPDPAGPHWWSVLDLAAARQTGIALLGPPPAVVIPPVTPERLRAAVADSQAWHDGSDAGSPNRVLNEARLIVLLERGQWVSKAEGARLIREQVPELADVVDEALRARAEGRGLDAGQAGRMSARLDQALG